MTILPTAYFPPLSYFSLLSKGDVFLEAHENYRKQSYRNRCVILSSNGPERLNVPVVHRCTEDGLFRVPIREIEIEWSRDWLTRHKRAIDSAYMSSAFFEHYREDLYRLLDRRPDTLWELNLSIINWFTDIWKLPAVGMTEKFTLNGDGKEAFRPDIHPKHPDEIYVPKPYWQVFSAKFPFTGNLSAMDLLFNEGTEGVCYL